MKVGFAKRRDGFAAAKDRASHDGKVGNARRPFTAQRLLGAEHPFSCRMAHLAKNPNLSEDKLGFFVEASPRIELGMKELQSSALPLGYDAKKMERTTRLELATSTMARWRSTR